MMNLFNEDPTLKLEKDHSIIEMDLLKNVVIFFQKYNDKKSTFYELLEKDGSVSVHKGNFCFLVCVMFKLKRCMTPELIKELILPNTQHRYELRNITDFTVPVVKSVHKGLESLSDLGPKIWEFGSLEIKQIDNLL